MTTGNDSAVIGAGEMGRAQARGLAGDQCREVRAALSSGDRAAVIVGTATLLIGGALLARPGRVGRLLAVDDPAAARIIGALDLALVPGLVLGPRRPLWLLGRGALNLGIAAHVLGAQRHTGRYGHAMKVAGVMAAATVGDSRTAYRSLRATP